MKKILFTLCLILCGLTSYGQSIYWKKSTQNFSNNKVVQAETEQYQIFELDLKALQSQLSSGKATQLSMPTSQGSFEDYVVEEKSSMAQELAEKYPAIKTYQGYKISDPKNRIALTLTSNGIYLYAFSEASEGMRMLSTNSYMFYKISGNERMSEGISCGVPSANQSIPADQAAPSGNRLDLTSQTTRNKVEGVRTLRLAVVSAGEYGEINGGTKETVLANIVSIVNGLNVISQQDLGIKYNLIANNDKLIFFNKATDPYNIEQNGISTNSAYLNTRTQVVIDSLIGQQNYDLGHLFIARNETQNPVPYGIGNAYGIGNVGTPEKGSGWSYFSKSTTNELGFIGLVSHEFGHHLGASHTFSNQVDGLVTQSELSSGRSIMSYGRINQPDLHYYHYHSIHQIIESFKRFQYGIDFSKVGTLVPYAQQPPANINLKAYHIPIKTPFVLETPSGLKNSNYFYNWEQLDSDLVLGGTYWGTKSQKAPLFSSTSPSANSQRYFPTYTRVLANNLTSDNTILAENAGTSMLFETLSEVPRQMTFGLSVRDRSAAQGVYLDSTQVTTVANSKPFAILTPLTAQLNGGSPLTLQWEISNTNDDPIKVSQVNILLSIDGGVKFDYLLAEKTANDGSQSVVIPNVATTTARIKIEPVDNIFYTINPTDFAINTTSLSLFSAATAVELTSCNEYKQTFNLQVQSNQATAALSNISFTGAPQGLTIALSKNQVAVNELFTATITNQTAAAGTYTITLRGELNGTTVERPIVLSILANTLSPVTLTSPTAGGTINQNSVELKWDQAANTQKVRLQISKDPNFSTLLIDKIIFGSQYLFSPLAKGTTYYWRVYAQNACGSSTAASSSFKVDLGYEKALKHNKDLYNTSNGQYPIQVTDSNTIKEVRLTVTIAKAASATLAKLNDMTMSLINPAGLAVVVSKPTTETTIVNLNSVSYVFKDQSPDFSSPIFNEDTQKWQLTVSPFEALSQFNGGNTLGNWIFKVEGKPANVSIEEVSIEFLSDLVFKAPSAENLSVYLFQNETKVSLLGKNYLGQSLVNSKIIINKLPEKGTLVDSQNNLLVVNTAYSFTDVYFVPNQGFQGVDLFNYQVVDVANNNLESTTAQVTIDYKNTKPALKVFDVYTSVQVDKSQTVNLIFKNAEFYNSYTYTLSSPMYGTTAINGNSVLYQATSVGDEAIEVTYTTGNTVAKGYIYIKNFAGYKAITEPLQVVKREDVGFRVGRTVAVNADGSILASSQEISWEVGDAGFNMKNYEGLTKVFTLQNGQYVPLGNEIKGQGINDRLGYRISLSGDGKTVALATNHVMGCMSCVVAGDYVIVYQYDEVLKTWVKRGDKIPFDGQGTGPGGVDIQSLDLNFDGSVLAVGNAREPINGYASGAAFIFSFDEISKTWVKKGSTINSITVGLSENGTDFGAFVRLNKEGNRLVLNQPYSFFNYTKAGNVYAFEFVQGEWKLLGQPISGTQGFFSRFGKTVDMNDSGDQIVISENYEVISNNEIYLGKAHAYTYDAATKKWKALGNQMKGPKITIAQAIDQWRFTDENAKVSISGAGNQVALSLKVTESFESNGNQKHFINVFDFDKVANTWAATSAPFATENTVPGAGHRPTYAETVISSNGAKVFFGSGEKIGYPEDKTFIRVYETTTNFIPDTQAPVLVLKNPYTLAIPASGTAVLEASSLDNGSTDNKGITEVTISKSTFTCANLGSNTITYTAKDAAGNTSTATVTILVVDEIKPTLKAKSAFTIKLDAEGKGSLKWEDLDEGSTDNCTIKDKLLSKSAFTCTDLGASKITYTVKDASGNTSSSEVTITVVDDIKPTLKAKTNFTVKLDAEGKGSLKWEDLDEGSTDNCAIKDKLLSKSAFTCADLGASKITVTAKDASGNTSTAEVTITVVDEIKPTVKAKTSYNIKLDTQGKATLKWEDIDEGSSDNCSIKERSLSKTEFTRTDGGESKITYTVTDVSGNTSSTEVTVRVDIVLASPERPKDANFLKAYPNPVSYYLYLEFAEGVSAGAIRSSSLVDASGRVLGELRLEDDGNGLLGFSTQSLKSGMYFLRLSTRDTLHLIKFTVIR